MESIVIGSHQVYLGRLKVFKNTSSSGHNRAVYTCQGINALPIPSSLLKQAALLSIAAVTRTDCNTVARFIGLTDFRQGIYTLMFMPCRFAVSLCSVQIEPCVPPCNTAARFIGLVDGTQGIYALVLRTIVKALARLSHGY